MKNLPKLLLAIFLLAFTSVSHSQTLTDKQQTVINKLFKNKGEVYFKFNITPGDEINMLTKIISIDNVKDNVVYAYANKKEFVKFLQHNYAYTVLPNPNTLQKVKTINASSLKELQLLSWTTYPSYSSYETIMNQFVTSYPSICKLVNIGTLSSGRKLLILKISDNVNTREDEPQFLYTSSMHGDETAGYVGMLNYIDYLLTNYGTNSRVTNLVNNMEIWINPLANPDGTYAGGNNTVNGATRYNGSYVDLNRNYPDPQAGQHPDGEAWQQETQAFMHFADTMNFVMSANFHGGAEVVNYPWDTWSELHADDNWWERVSKRYADTVFANSPNGYFNSVTPSGYTNGYAWYQVEGGRQDYMTYFKHSRECTIELSDNKLLQSSQLMNNFNYNYRSWLNYMEEALHGIRGIVTDSCSGEPLRAKVFISGHDFDSSHVYSALPIGDYHRPIYQGTYNVTFSATGYQSRTINGISVINGNATVVNVILKPNSIPATPVITQDFASLISNAANGNQWYNVDSGIITGATGTTFSPTVSGQYYVIVTNGNGCSSDTSNVIDFLYTGISEISNETFTIYPNPNNGNFIIALNGFENRNAVIEMYDVTGKLLFTEQTIGNSSKEYSLNFVSGVYFIKVSANNFLFTEKLVIEKK